MSNIVHTPKTWVKITRSGERFWLHTIRTENGVKSGVVDNHLQVAPYKFGERIEFEDGEVVDMIQTTAGQEYQP